MVPWQVLVLQRIPESCSPAEGAPVAASISSVRKLASLRAGPGICQFAGFIKVVRDVCNVRSAACRFGTQQLLHAAIASVSLEEDESA